MTVASLAVTIEARADGESSEATQWLNLMAFGRVADDLARHGKGELVSVAGRLQLSRYTNRETGEAREGWQVVLDSLVSARTVRPKGGRRSGADKGGEPVPAMPPRYGPHAAPVAARRGSGAGEVPASRSMMRCRSETKCGRPGWRRDRPRRCNP